MLIRSQLFQTASMSIVQYLETLIDHNDDKWVRYSIRYPDVEYNRIIPINIFNTYKPITHQEAFNIGMILDGGDIEDEIYINYMNAQ